MTTQTEMFPKTELDQEHAVLTHLLNEEEKCSTAVDNAERKLSEAQSRVYKQRQVISWLQAAMPAAEALVESETIEDAEVIDESHQIEGDVLDPITGEVTCLVTCTECQGEGRLEDKTGGGHHRCKACGGSGRVESKADHDGVCVVAVYPSGNPVATEIGPNTQYAELIADYLASVEAQGLTGEYRYLEAWRVVAENELSDPDFEYGRREPHEVITSEDYGHRLLIVSVEQGSAVGVAAEESAA